MPHAHGHSALMRFDLLPLEIIHHVASFVPARDVLALAASSKHLRQACYNPLVFRATLEHDLQFMGLDPNPAPALDLDALAPLLGRSVHAWARLAVANSLARCWTDACSPSSSIPSSWHHFVPQLLVIGHPWLLDKIAIHASDILDSSVRISPGSRLFNPRRPVTRLTSMDALQADKQAIDAQLNRSASAFCLCAAALSHTRGVEDHWSLQMNDIFLCRLEEGVQSDDGLGPAMGDLATWAWMLNDFLEQHPLSLQHEQPSNGPAARFVPRLENLPWYRDLREGANIPLPFTDGDDTALKSTRTCDWDRWLNAQVEHFSRPATLAESTWCGYWSFGRERRHDVPTVEFADAVEGLNIRATEPRDDPEPGSVGLIGTYTEHVLDFHLVGFLTPSGCFRLGPPGEFWCWHGRVTPFGLFGKWGSIDGEQFAGACWLWPQVWTEETNRKRCAEGRGDTPADVL